MARIGWYEVIDSYEADGIHIAVRDLRTDEVIEFTVEYAQTYNLVIDYLRDHQMVGELEHLLDVI